MYITPHSAVICAAGVGTRMGCPKALCLLGHRSFLFSIVETLKAANIHSIFVVIGAEAERVRQYHARLDVQWVYNPQWDSTYMLESLVCGLQFVPEHHAVLHWPVDCVDVHVSDIRALMASEAPLASLAFDGVAGHPMRLAPNSVDELRASSKRYSSLRDFVDHKGLFLIPAVYPALMNCNTPDQLSAYLQKSLPKIP